MSFEETINDIVLCKKSISRFGDGEIRMMLGEGSIGFQKENRRLTEKLIDVINSNFESHLVALPNTFGVNSQYRLDSQIFWFGFNFKYARRFLTKICLKKVYGDSTVTRFYMPYKNKNNVIEKVRKIKTIWNRQNILIVEGTDTKLGIGNNLFSNVLSIERIICPSKNAFNKYNEILEVVSSLGQNKLILIALGPTASVLAYDLAVRGFWAVDIGHIDIEYMWFLQNARKKEAVAGKYVNETNMQNNSTTEEDDDNYVSSIIATILR